MRNLTHDFDIYLVNVKTIKQIAQIFVAFSEKLNFMHKQDETTITDLRDSPHRSLAKKHKIRL